MNIAITIFFFVFFLSCNGLLSQDKSSPFSDQINSSYDERAPMLHPEGGKLFFTRSKHPDNTGGTQDEGDIWMSEIENGEWQKPVPVPFPWNNQHYNALAGFFPNGDVLLYQRVSAKFKSRKIPPLLISKKENQTYSEPRPVEIDYFTNASDHFSAFLSHDGQILLMSIESFGGHGAEDIYVSFKRADNSFSEPRNLGFQINSRYQEMSPYLAPDNQSLYFSSNGHGGEGSWDFFKATRLDNTWRNWTEPQNLGDSLNSRGAELYFRMAPTQELLYFISTRNSEGYGDIRKWQEPIRVPQEADNDLDDMPLALRSESDGEITTVVPEETSSNKEAALLFTLNGEVRDQLSGKRISGKVFVQIEDDLKELEVEDGRFAWKTEQLGKALIVWAEAEGYFGKEEQLMSRAGEQKLNLFLSPLKEGQSIRLNNILFEQSTVELLEGGKSELKRLENLLQANPNMRIELSGHTDNRGSAKLNIELSQKRVEKIKSMLAEAGIDEDRIEGVGYGGLRPIAPNDTDENRQLNRRVEFKVLEQ